MLLGMMRLLSIKDLKDLSFPGRGDYRHAGPKGPEEAFFYGCARGGQAPALRLSRPSPFHRRARACPSPCYRVHARLRGTGPRPTGQEGILLAMRHSGSGEPELQSFTPHLANRDNLVNPAHILVQNPAHFFIL